MATISYVEYPIYSIATDGEIVATSGGGGGSDYGIEDQLETHRVNLETGQLLPVVSTAEAGGVIDSLGFNKNVDLWCGCCQGQVVLFKQDRDHGLGVVARFGPPPASGGKRPRLVASCGADNKLCLWDWRTGALLHTIEKQNPRKAEEKLTFRCGRSIAYGGAAPSHPDPAADKKSEGSAPSAGSNGVPSPLPASSSVTVTQLCEFMCDDSVPCCQAEISTDGQLIAVGFADGKCKVYNRGYVSN
ncbi:conserved hypothetical protein [Neospora caninum Liverpool]|uniref:Uncharacterized protein n=1 Tax=Neospora caninum (strain Liverpool) TaxID=572307 RepID=F0V7B5_NEOCL|nr:conserved hypothetical protein [Neospora caninum Liverpool]CBZ49606.1 conserved hypothetical protein [Neospora caninum Liverpool]|eukprot:XP_003879641.1 conserved hypothetical protein [Neospora caninum Liverpool]